MIRGGVVVASTAAVSLPDVPSLYSAPAVARAYATLRQGVDFVGGIAAWDTPPAGGRAAIARTRYIGNCLRELDRFLGVLLEEVGRSHPVRLLTLKRDTATQIVDYSTDCWDAVPAQFRLRALDRSRMCLLHNAGRVSRADSCDSRWMTSGWREPGRVGLRRYALGTDMRPDAGQLHDIANFYDDLGERVVARRRHA